MSRRAGNPRRGRWDGRAEALGVYQLAMMQPGATKTCIRGCGGRSLASIVSLIV